MNIGLHARRKLVNRLALGLSLAAMAFGLFWLAWILLEVFRLGFSALSLELFTQMTPAPGSEGGLANAIVGSLILVGLAMLVATPIGILAGIYLAEYGERGWLAPATRFVNDVLLSAPSIVIGLFVYAVIVTAMKAFSGLAGVTALALIVIPVVVRTTENMLILVPNSLREAAYALGAQQLRLRIGRFQEGFRQRGLVIRDVRLVGNQRQRPVIPFLAKRDRELAAPVSRPDDRHAVFHPVTENPSRTIESIRIAVRCIMPECGRRMCRRNDLRRRACRPQRQRRREVLAQGRPGVEVRIPGAGDDHLQQQRHRREPHHHGRDQRRGDHKDGRRRAGAEGGGVIPVQARPVTAPAVRDRRRSRHRARGNDE